MSSEGHKNSELRSCVQDPNISRCYYPLSVWMVKEIRHCYRELTEKVGGLADVDYKLHDRPATLEVTYSKAKIKPNDINCCSKFLKLNSAAHTKPI
ncbi:MAG: hypothetical protein ACJ71D_09220 [Nitrososphaera sp.]